MATTTATVETPQGPGRLILDTANDPAAILVLGHGAGGGPNATDLQLLAQQLPPRAITVARFEQPWRMAGRRVAGPHQALDDAWVAAVQWLRHQPWGAQPLFVGGRSAGARVACRTADLLGPVGIVCLAFPLHLPGRPEKSRVAELLEPVAPRLVLQGSSDAFGTAAEVCSAAGKATGIRLVELPGTDHSFRVAKSSTFTPGDLRDALVSEISRFVGTGLGIPSL